MLEFLLRSMWICVIWWTQCYCCLFLKAIIVLQSSTMGIFLVNCSTAFNSQHLLHQGRHFGNNIILMLFNGAISCDGCRYWWFTNIAWWWFAYHVVAEKRKQCLSSAFDGSYVSADNLILNESWFLRYEQVFMLWIEA